jgi:alanine racemase
LTVALVLTVNTDSWNRQVDALATSVAGLVPVVKGNGYGFGRDWLADRAASFASHVAVGTVFEVSSVPAQCTPVVLTPSLDIPQSLRDDAILTVGSIAHINAIASHKKSRQVLIKIRSSMNRYGVAVEEVAELLQQCQTNNLHVRGVSIHPPLTGSSSDHVREIENLLSTIDPSIPAWVSHVDAQDFTGLQTRYAERQWFLRLGTSLWHGDKTALKLTADVIETVAIVAGQRVGYHGVEISQNGTLVMIGCGSAHGVAPLADNLSPFHFSRQRMQLIEAPHMHTSMCFIPSGQPTPVVGDQVDVQRPLITTSVDRVDWL